MCKQIALLCRLQLCNLCGFNEFRHTKDEKKKKRFLGMAVLWMLLIIMVVGYVAAFAFGMALMKMTSLIPIYLYAIVSLLILFLTFFKAGSLIFAMKGYEVLVSLPVSKVAVVISRFCSMYLTNLLAGLLVMIPGIVIYGYFEQPGLGFYVVSIIATIFLPLFPLTIASILGAGITAISARMKHKSLGEAALMLLVLVGIMLGSMTMSAQAEQLDIQQLQNLAETLTVQIGNLYPPAHWYAEAVLGNYILLVPLLLLPAVIFAGFVAVIQRFFQQICGAICGTSARNNYVMKELHTSGITLALWKKELKRYFASGIYVTNTIVGYALAVLAAVAMLLVGTEELEAMVGFSGVSEIIERCLPQGLAFLLSITTMTSCSVSMEGRSFWQLQILPVSCKAVYDSKILANLAVAGPFYLVTVVLLCLATKPDFAGAIWIVVIPACYLVFMAVLGLTVNLAFPVLNWENEVQVVKQSAATLVTMLVGMIASILPLVAMIVVPKEMVLPVRVLTVLILMIVTGILYCRNNRKELIHCL